PDSLLPGRCARWVEKALLSDEDERTLGRRPARDLCFALGDLIEGPSEVHGAGAKAVFRAPRDRAVDRVVKLEDAGPVAKRTELRAIAIRQPRASDRVELSGCDVAEVRARRAQLVEAPHGAARLDRAAEGSQTGGERIGDALRPATWHRPVRHV